MPRIADIQCFPLRCELSKSVGFSQWYYRQKNNLLVKVLLDNGVFGWGECYGPNLAIATSIEQHFKPKLLGGAPMETERLWGVMWNSFHDFNRKGIFLAAMSGIDLAIWDVKGKLLNMPVREILGGKSDPIPCYATGMYYSDEICEDKLLTQLLEEAKGYLDSGYHILKVKVGKNMAFDENLIREFRSHFPKVKLAADANHAYQFKEAIRVGKWLEECDYCWFEEPLAPDNYHDMATLRTQLSIPISAGECEQTRWGFLQLANQRCVDIMQPDVAFCGGLTEFSKIASIASAHHLDVMPHCWGLKVNQAAAATAISILHENPGRFESRKVYLEMDQTENEIRDSIFTSSHEVRSAELHFNDLPGLGIEVDEVAMHKYLIPFTDIMSAK